MDNYVFKFIPLLNADGVTRGQWRFDTNGVNLNRKYDSEEDELYPTILASKKAVIEDFENNNLKMFMDFHAH